MRKFASLKIQFHITFCSGFENFMDRQATTENPYLPPVPTSSDNHKSELTSNVPKPIIPALIGIVTYGSSSPYALVLCIEQYLRPAAARITLTTHISMVLSIAGTIGWGGLSYIMGAETIKFLADSGRSMYGPMGLFIWIANFILFFWIYWRIKLFQRHGGSSS